MTADKFKKELERIFDEYVDEDKDILLDALISQYRSDVQTEILMAFKVQSKGMWTIHEIIKYIEELIEPT